jgi:hypothetical protein
VFFDFGPQAPMTLLQSIRNSTDFTVTSVDQDVVTGELIISSGNTETHLVPVEVTYAPSEPPGTYYTEDGDVVIVTDDGFRVVCYPVVNDEAAMRTSLGGLSLSFDARANLVITTPNGKSAFAARPAAMAVPAYRFTTPGLKLYKRANPKNVFGATLVYENAGGELMEQDLFPVPVNWPALKQTLLSVSIVDSVNISTEGIITINMGNTVVLRAMADFMVIKAQEPGSAIVEFSPAGDVNGDGKNDYILVYPNGDMQLVYILP